MISTSQAAAQLNCTKRWVIELLNTGKLRGQLVDGRWIMFQEDLDRYIAEQADSERANKK
jgi:excisionase family DNA binding protein